MLDGRKLGVLLALAVLAYGAPAGAVEAFGRTPQEEALCSTYVYGAGAKDLGNRRDWQHMHHYCDCVRFRYRAIRTMGDKATFRYNLESAIDGCDYVLQHTTKAFIMRPKVHIDKGRALKLKGDKALAAQEFSTAIETDPTEVNAFNELSLLQEEGGKKAEARETIARGLRHNPDSIQLQKRYLELGGTKPFPEPIARVEPAPEEKAVEPDLPELQGLRPVEPVIQVDAVTEHQDKSSEGDQAGPPDAASAGRSCRFCPPEEVHRRWVESFKSRQEKKPE
ncbi:tetratricopeptide repeat protein [Aromatoleum petrolei]|uniref:Tetratricopeptide repeat protein n=1 Tax=Aromatoleum petrolei TaxID=76116 RepID=A0ABX1MQF2_9RHOO|nr:tetratricopeptide repeat protein [Aromatoleum petrolei]NMF87372.1 hypothetical protein [Aromatoleum petrolei]QTQ35739.1 Uncharacterized protein ToN1_15820 [Aromatoleum petrolei]